MAALFGGALIVWIGVSGGFGVSPDSANYLSAARSLLEDRTYRTVTGAPFVHWPPGIPTLLALGHLFTGLSYVTVASVLNGVSHGLIVYLGLRLAAGSVRSPVIILLAGVALVAGFPLLDTARYVWSEPAFNALVMLWIYGHVHPGRRIPGGAKSGQSSGPAASNAGLKRWAVVAALTLAPLVRYAGVVLYAGELLLQIVGTGRGDRRRRAVRTVGVLALCALPTALWIGRNLVQVGAVTGERGASVAGVGDALSELARVPFDWLYVDLPAVSVREALPVSPILLVGLVGLWLGAIAWKNRRLRLELLVLGRRYASLLLFSVLYLAFLVFIRATVGIDRLEIRLTSPLVAPLVVLLFAGADRYVSRVSGIAPKLAIILGAALFAFGSASRAPGIATHSDGLGYLGDEWEAIAWDEVVRREEEGRIWSNAPEGIFVWTGIRSALLPRERYYRSREETDDLGEWTNEACGGEEPRYVIWFEAERRAYLFSPSELRRQVTLMPDEPSELSDVEIYRVACGDGRQSGAGGSATALHSPLR